MAWRAFATAAGRTNQLARCQAIARSMNPPVMPHSLWHSRAIRIASYCRWLRAHASEGDTAPPHHISGKGVARLSALSGLSKKERFARLLARQAGQANECAHCIPGGSEKAHFLSSVD